MSWKWRGEGRPAGQGRAGQAGQPRTGDLSVYCRYPWGPIKPLSNKPFARISCLGYPSFRLSLH